MSDFNYGVLVGSVCNIIADRANERTPHYMITVQTNKEDLYSAQINCQSCDKKKSKLLLYVEENFNGELTNKLRNLDFGFHEINYPNLNSDIAVDYVRSNLFNREDMNVLAYDIEGENDLKGIIDKNMNKALDNDNVVIYVYGTFFEGDHGKGVHNVHMNQGNRDKQYDENNIFQDGCFFINFKDENCWKAYFLAFQNQSWNTDDFGKPMD
ncbi:YukJ family protein [Natronospora cellulosivora (SeqCode)]